jgi:hypothetical protein
MEAPPAGTKCTDCGCCEAAIAVGDGTNLCWPCDEGTPCKSKQHSQSIKNGLGVARQNGVHIGRPEREVNSEKIEELRTNGQSYRQIASTLNLPLSTVHRKRGPRGPYKKNAEKPAEEASPKATGVAVPDPYAVIIADLEAQVAELQQLISMLKNRRACKNLMSS